MFNWIAEDFCFSNYYYFHNIVAQTDSHYFIAKLSICSSPQMTRKWLWLFCMAVLSFSLCLFLFFFVWLGDEKCQTRLPPEPTHLRPWPLRPWRRLYNHCSASDRWGKRAFCLPTVSATLSTFYCSSGWFLFFSWMSFKHGAALGGARRFYISSSPLWGLSQLGPIMCILNKHRPAS